MKKQILGIFLVLCIAASLLPSAAFAEQSGDTPPVNTSESEPVLLGTEAEYATTLATMFDKYGLRKIEIGFNGNDGILNRKVGLVNKHGNFVAQPIYDKIELYAKDDRLSEYGVSTLPFNFIGGYTQAVRDGKMGLLNTRGEEVIPCQYDFVQMPSEGVCAVYQKIDKDKSYLGYWSLEQNREIVAPNKYITNYKGIAIGAFGGTAKISGKQKPTGDYFNFHDFIGGYALVTIDGSSHSPIYATVVDKNGNEVLQKSYEISGFNFAQGGYDLYPQKGPYLSFVEPKNFDGYRFTKLYNEWGPEKNHELSVKKSYATGLAGADGILIPATYTTGVLASPGEGSFFINSAPFQIILDKRLILTQKDVLEGYLYGGAYGVIDFNGNTVLPFTHLVNQSLSYYPDENVFKGILGTLYNINGQKLNDYQIEWIYNGYGIASKVGDFSGEKDSHEITRYVVRADGTEFNITQALGLDPYKSETFESSKVSTSGTFWVKNSNGAWGLMDFSGNTILPFEFDDVSHNAWAEGENGFARVTKNGKVGMVNAQGKQVLPCEYKKIVNNSINSDTVMIENDNGKGIAETKTGRIIIPPEYSSLGAFAGFKQYKYTPFDMGVCYAEKGENNLLLDAGGNVVFSTTKKFGEASNGLYHFNDNSGYFDTRGRVIVTDNLCKTTNLEIGASYTIYIENGNVYRVSANYIDSTYGFKPFAPQEATATPSSTKLMVNGKDVAADAYNIGGNNYIKLRDLATMVNGTEKNFEVTWNGTQNAINLVSNKAYTPAGGEMAMGDGRDKRASRTNAKIFVDGGEVVMTAYSIGGNNYFKLRDVMQIFDINVGWDGATSTATLTTNERYALASYEQGKLDAYAKAYAQASGNPYVPKPTYKEGLVQFRSTPTKVIYKVGEPFEIAGFKAFWMDIYSRGTDISNDIELKTNRTKIYDGYKFQQAGEKTIDCYYKGEKLNNFKITVVEEDNNLLAEGDYYMQIYGKYITPVRASGAFYLELSNQKPEKPFNVKLIKIDAERGPLYTIMYDGTYVGQPSSREGAQLQSMNGIPHQWRINQYSSFCTIRDYGNQKLIVNASGQKSDNGTKVIVWKSTGKAPDNAKIVFTKVN